MIQRNGNLTRNSAVKPLFQFRANFGLTGVVHEDGLISFWFDWGL